MVTFDEISKYPRWYHRIDFGNGLITTGDRNQELTYNVLSKMLPDNLEGKTVLDCGANACGLSVEFAKRGATVVAIEQSEYYVKQANMVIDHFGLKDKITVLTRDIYDLSDIGQFDIVACVGLIYHLRYPQLLLDALSTKCKDLFFVSTQIHGTENFVMRNRAANQRDPKDVGTLYGYEPSEAMFVEMISSAGFNNVKMLSRHPHEGASVGNTLGNFVYYGANINKPSDNIVVDRVTSSR
jgi:SAM-dependent methyltransferase